MKKFLAFILLASLLIAPSFAGGAGESSAVAAESDVTTVTFVFADGDAGAKASINEIVVDLFVCNLSQGQPPGALRIEIIVYSLSILELKSSACLK